MEILTFVISIDGKLITDPSLLAQFQITHQSFDLNSIHKAQEISVILLPIILGGHQRPTITGSVGSFLKTQEEWVLRNKRVIKNVCYLRYRKKCLPLSKAKGLGVSA